MQHVDGGFTSIFDLDFFDGKRELETAYRYNQTYQDQLEVETTIGMNQTPKAMTTLLFTVLGSLDRTACHDAKACDCPPPRICQDEQRRIFLQPWLWLERRQQDLEHQSWRTVQYTLQPEVPTDQ
jgi:hypothetical protein